MLFSSRVGVRFSEWLVSGYAHVFVLFSVTTVTLPKPTSTAYTDTNTRRSFRRRDFRLEPAGWLRRYWHRQAISAAAVSVCTCSWSWDSTPRTERWSSVRSRCRTVFPLRGRRRLAWTLTAQQMPRINRPSQWVLKTSDDGCMATEVRDCRLGLLY